MSRHKVKRPSMRERVDGWMSAGPGRAVTTRNIGAHVSVVLRIGDRVLASSAAPTIEEACAIALDRLARTLARAS